MKFIVLSSQRSGSTFLTRALNSHPQIRCHGEVFLNPRDDKSQPHDERIYRYLRARPAARLLYPLRRRRYVRNYLDYLYEESGEARSIGFKLMYNQCRPEVFEWLENNDVAVIHLMRENLLRVIISQELYTKTGIAHSNSGIELGAFKVDAQLVLKRMRMLADRMAQNEKRFSGFSRYVRITYESFFTDVTEESRKLLRFLGVDEAVTLRCKLKPINTKPLQELIMNYEDLCEVLGNTPFEAMLG